MSSGLFAQDILTPSAVANLIQKEVLDILGRVKVEGEISSLVKGNSGHYYFNLKDDLAQLKAVIWRSNASRGGALQAENGLKVLATGYLSVYKPRSEYQIIVESLRPQGEGALRLAFEKLKKRLESEGLFSPARKRPLARTPFKVALLSSPGSASATDFLTTSISRTRLLHISLFPVPVQGAGAADEIASALSEVNQGGGYDLIVLTRGGGSLEDMWAFNEEILVRAVASSRTPVLAAIGHSTDISLAAMAADLKAITPTAAAEAIWPLDSDRLERLARCRASLARSKKEILSSRLEKLASLSSGLARFKIALMGAVQTMDSLSMRLESAASLALYQKRGRLEALTRDLLLRSPALELQRRKARLSELEERLKAACLRRLKELSSSLASAAERLGPPSRLEREIRERRALLEGASKRLAGAAERTLSEKSQALAQAQARLGLVSPKRILSRGYAMVTGPDGRVLTKASQASVGQSVILTMADGRLSASITSILDD